MTKNRPTASSISDSSRLALLSLRSLARAHNDPSFSRFLTLVMPLAAAPLAGSDDDPWKASALILALSQLLLSILYLLQTFVACLTLQVTKYIGLGNSCWYATYRHYFNSPSQAGHLPREFQENGAFRRGHVRPFSRSGASSSSEPSANSNVNSGSGVLIRGVEASLTRSVSTKRGSIVRRRPKTEEDDSGFSSMENKESVLSRSRSPDWCVPKITTLVCPNCNATWTVTRPPVFNGANHILRVKTRCEDGLTGSKEEGFHWQGRAASPARTDEQWGNAKRQGLPAKTQEENKESAGCQVSYELQAKGSCNKEVQLPAQNFPLQAEEVFEDALNGDEEASVRLGHEQTGLDIAGIEARKLFSDNPESPRSKLASCLKEIAEENDTFGMPGSVENRDRIMDSEADLETEGDYESSADVIISLRKALQMKRKDFCALHEEFEEERNAAETAANEAIGMISRLQEEKAALQMESAHYQRMAEEKANYDEQAMQLLKEVLYKRERENFFLEKEVKLFKSWFFREVSRATKRRKELENASLSLSGREPMLLLECTEEASVSRENQELSTADLQVQSVEQRCTISHGVGSGESLSAKSSFRTEITDEQPHKRLKGFTVHADESNGLPCFLDSESDLAFSTLGGANEFEQVCQGSFPQRVQLEQCEQTTGMPGAAVDEDEINIILHQLMDLEEQLRARGKADGFEPRNLAQILENHVVSDAIEYASIATVTKDQIVLDSSPFDVVRVLSPGRECKAARCNDETLGPMRDVLCKPPGMLECPDALYFDKRSSLDIYVTTSHSQLREGAQMGTVHDTSEIPLREEARHCSSHCEDNVTTQDNANPAGKSEYLSYSLHDDGTRASFGTSLKNVTQDSSLEPSCDAGPVYSSGAHSQHDIVVESSQCQLHGTDFTSEDDKWNFTEEEFLQSEGVPERQPSTSLNPKDLRISLLKEVSQQLQELSQSNNSSADSVQSLLPVPADSCFLFTSKTDTIIRKRHFLNGPGQV